MHEIKINRNKLDTDLIVEKKEFKNKGKITKYSNNIKVEKVVFNTNNYTTIYFKDITDKDNYMKVQKVFINNLKKYLKLKKDDKLLVVGLGNNKSTPDSLGPSIVENILVTSYLFDLGDVDSNYSNVSKFSPNVKANTGIETSNIIKSIIKNNKFTKIIVIDALKTNDFNRLVKTIQISDYGIFPGSGIGNNRLEISTNTMNIPVISIGVPTVIDINNNMIMTPTSIDYQIDKLSSLIGNGINISLHKNFIRHNN